MQQDIIALDTLTENNHSGLIPINRDRSKNGCEPRFWPMRYDRNRPSHFQIGFLTSREDTVGPSPCLNVLPKTLRRAGQGERQSQVLDKVY